jgi:hypothetical protein
MGAPKGMSIDHINHNTLDNRKANLRIVTHQQNNTNRNGAYSTSKTGIRGVSIHQSNGPAKTIYYVFRCHCVTCKVAKYFAYTDEGLSNAAQFAEKHFAAMEV